MTDELGGRGMCYVDVDDLLAEAEELAADEQMLYHIRQARSHYRARQREGDDEQ